MIIETVAILDSLMLDQIVISANVGLNLIGCKG